MLYFIIFFPFGIHFFLFWRILVHLYVHIADYIDIIFVQAFIFKNLLYSIHVFFSVHVILPALQPPPTKTNQPQVRQRRSGVDVAPYDISELCWAGGVRDPNKNTEKNEEGMASCHFLLI